MNTINNPAEHTVAELHRCLAAAVKRLAELSTVDTDIAIVRDGGIALGDAKDIGLIADDGSFSAALGIVPIDDDARSFADSLLDDDVIEAGELVQDRVHEDNLNYVSGVTIDWDQGMVAVAIYRAMTLKARGIAAKPASA